METLIENWENEVRQSDLIILSDGDAYLPRHGILVSDVVQQLAYGLGEQILLRAHPALTDSDLRVCSLFCYLKTIHRI